VGEVAQLAKSAICPIAATAGRLDAGQLGPARRS
jgi:hypothetical protein